MFNWVTNNCYVSPARESGCVPIMYKLSKAKQVELI